MINPVTIYIVGVVIAITALKIIKKGMTEDGSSLLPKLSFGSLIFRTRRKVNKFLVKHVEGRANNGTM
ncbi:MAG: hypothetical protein R3B55_03160 [Candidatus Paceibacterota bacterium]